MTLAETGIHASLSGFRNNAIEHKDTHATKTQLGAAGQWIGLMRSQSFFIQPGAVDTAQVEYLIAIRGPPDGDVPPGKSQAVPPKWSKIKQIL